MADPSPQSLHSDHAKRLVHLSTLPSVVMRPEDKAALVAGAAALEREQRAKERAR